MERVTETIPEILGPKSWCLVSLPESKVLECLILSNTTPESPDNEKRINISSIELKRFMVKKKLLTCQVGACTRSETKYHVIFTTNMLLSWEKY